MVALWPPPADATLCDRMGRASGNKKRRRGDEPAADAVATATRPPADHGSPREPGAPTPRNASLRPTLGWTALLVFAVAALVYANTLYCGFTWDDQWLILENRRIQDPSYIRFLLLEQKHLWRPLKRMSFMLDYYLWGRDRPAGFHLTNIVFHAGASVALYAFALRLGLRRVGAAFAALLFAVHPVHVEAVANISHRKEPMALLFYLLAFLAYLRARDDEPTSLVTWLGRGLGLWRRGPTWLARVELLTWACFSYLLGMMSKEVGAVMFPVTAVVYEFLLAGGSARQRVRRLLYLAIPSVSVLLLFTYRSWLRGLVKRFTPEDVSWVTGGKTESFLVLFLTEVKAFWEYLRLLVVPWPLYLDRKISLVKTAADPLTLLGFLGIALLLAGIVWSARRAPIVCFALSWYGLNLLPVWNIPPLTHWLMAERFIYVPSAGFAILLGVGFEAWYAGRLHRSPSARGSRRTVLATGALVLLVFSGMTVAQNRVWTSNETLWLHTLARNPNSDRGLHGYGLELYNRGDYANAEKYYRRSLEVSPTYPEPRYALSLLLLNQKRYEEAIEHATFDAKLEEGNPEPFMVIGNAEFGLGRYDRAIEAYKQAVERDGSHLAARFNLANAYTAAGDQELALRTLDDALGVGEDADLWLLRGDILQALRRLPEALDAYVRATELGPQVSEAWNGMGRVYLMLGDREAAGRAYRRSLELDPKQEEVVALVGQLP